MAPGALTMTLTRNPTVGSRVASGMAPGMAWHGMAQWNHRIASFAWRLVLDLTISISFF